MTNTSTDKRSANAQRVLELSMKDTARNSMVALPLISLFEIALIARWFLMGKGSEDAGFLIGYVALLAVSIATFAFIYIARKDIAKYARAINVAQHIYAITIIVWALLFCHTSVFHRGYLEYLVYLTIITIVPVFCYIPTGRWIAIQTASAGVMLWLASHVEHFSSFAINFLVFTIISIIAGCSFYLIRKVSYERLIDLEKESYHANEYARTDILTGLPNRRSFREALDQVSQDIPGDLALAVFDVNELKKINDTLGHDAGDELIAGAASCLRRAFGHLGQVYRVGGDEFAGILRGTGQDVQAALEKLEQETAQWKGATAPSVSISAGTASAADFPAAITDELSIIADKVMYKQKNLYYKTHARHQR